jgi:hypothetical protein
METLFESPQKLSVNLPFKSGTHRYLVASGRHVEGHVRSLISADTVDHQRAKRAAIKKFGKSSCQDTAERWRRFAAWARYHLLYFKLQSCGQPYRAKLWREQRQRLTELFRKVLRERFFECPSDSELTRIVTLGTTSARRGRLGVTLRTLLNAPESYGDTLFQFIDQRIKLKPLPGAPIPFWKQVSDRGDRFRDSLERRRAGIATAPSTPPQAAHIGQVPAQQRTRVISIEPISRCTERINVSDEKIRDSLGAWFNEEVIPGFERPVVEPAQFLIGHNLHEQYRRQTSATTLKGLIEELRPAEDPRLAEEPINEFVGWVLGCLLAVRSDRSAIYDGVTFAFGQAVAIREGRQNAK